MSLQLECSDDEPQRGVSTDDSLYRDEVPTTATSENRVRRGARRIVVACCITLLCHGSASVVRTTTPVNGEARNSTLTVPKCPWTNAYQTFYGWLGRGYVRCIKFHYGSIRAPFWVLLTCYNQGYCADFGAQYVKRRSAQGYVVFWGPEHLIFHFDQISTKNKDIFGRFSIAQKISAYGSFWHRRLHR